MGAFGSGALSVDTEPWVSRSCRCSTHSVRGDRWNPAQVRAACTTSSKVGRGSVGSCRAIRWSRSPSKQAAMAIPAVCGRIVGVEVEHRCVCDGGDRDRDKIDVAQRAVRRRDRQGVGTVEIRIAEVVHARQRQVHLGQRAGDRDSMGQVAGEQCEPGNNGHASIQGRQRHGERRSRPRRRPTGRG